MSVAVAAPARSMLRLLLYRAKTLLFDWSFQPVLSWLVAAALYVVSVVLRSVAPASAFSSSLRAHSLLVRSGCHDAASSSLHARLEKSIAAALTRRPGRLRLERVRAKVRRVDAGDLTETLRIAGLVLKMPGQRAGGSIEKGVLLLVNNERARAFADAVDMPRLLEDYALVIETSWSGYANREILSFARFAPHPVVVLAPDHRDRRFLERLRTNLVPVPFGCGDWVDPATFRPLAGVEKRFDAVMVARWSLMKRHHALFRAVRDLRDPSFRLALVGRRLDISADGAVIRSSMKRLGIASQVTIYEDLTQDAVNQVLNQSKVNVLVSRQEGSTRSICEGFFAGVPALALERNVGLDKEYFTAETGTLVAESNLAGALADFRARWREFAPRPWAERTIAPEITTAKLNAVLRTLSSQRGEEWTRDAVSKCNAPRPRYHPDADVGRGFPSTLDLIAQYPRRCRARSAST